MNKIFSAFNDLNDLSCQIIKSGIILSIGLLFCALIIKQLNLAGQFTIEIQYSSLFAFQVSAAVFAESVIGGLLFDFFLKKQ